MTPGHAMSHMRQEIGAPFICFHYIHQNPVKAGLVSRMKDWEFSSYKDYAGLRYGTLCNRQIAADLLDIPQTNKDFADQSYSVMPDSFEEL